MSDPNNKPKKETEHPKDCDEQSLDCAEKKLHSSVAKDNPEWVDENGECPSCTSLEHELAADPTNVPEDVEKTSE